MHVKNIKLEMFGLKLNKYSKPITSQIIIFKLQSRLKEKNQIKIRAVFDQKLQSALNLLITGVRKFIKTKTEIKY